MTKSSRSISLEDLGEYLTVAKEKLSREKKDILADETLPGGFNREEYAFAYLRAERIGMQAINARLAEISWLPMQLDPQSELVADNRTPMKRWLAATGKDSPDAEEFGNDFIHALTRAAVCHGWERAETRKLTGRIATLFLDLSCLVGMIYYSSWLAEHEVEGVTLTDPSDLGRSVVEIAAIVQSPELHRALRVRAEEVKKAAAKKALEKPATKGRPILRLIRNEDYVDPLLGDPLPA